MLPAPIREFLEDALCSSSWSAGVVAETLWRACFLKERFENAGNAAAETEEYNAMSWAGAWIKAADKISMFASAMDLVRSGYSVSSYGMGWVRVFLLQEMLEDFVCDALASGMVPSMIEIPVDQFNSGDKFLWGGDRNAKGLAYLQSTKQRDLLLNLDRLALQAA
jgi:hypothetical protein